MHLLKLNSRGMRDWKEKKRVKILHNFFALIDIYKSVDKAEGLQQREKQHSDKCVSKTMMNLSINVIHSMNTGTQVHF